MRRPSSGQLVSIGVVPVAMFVALLLSMILQVGCDAGEAPPSRSAMTSQGDATTGPGARRVVSLSPVATALVFELDCLDRLVAVDEVSGQQPGLERRARVPESDDDAFLAITGSEADLVILPVSRLALSQRLRRAGIRTVGVALRDFDDGFTLWSDLAGRLGRGTAMRDRIVSVSRPLAEIAAESYGAPRPHVAVIESFEPLRIVGGDQFSTALVEIAGGENATHGRPEASIPIERDALRALEPRLLFHSSRQAIDERERQALADSVADIAPLVVVEFDPLRFFTPDAVEAARSLREAIVALEPPAPADPAPTTPPSAQRP